MKFDWQCEAQCPFLIAVEKSCVRCEGVEEGQRLELKFPDKNEKQGYMLRYCCSNRWEHCRVARMLTEKYEVRG